MQEPIPLARVHALIFDFCRARASLCIFGAQAVNAYVAEPRMTADVDIMSPTPEATANELAEHLNRMLHIAARVREVRPGIGYRVYQAQKEGSRQLADIRLAPPDLDTTTLEGLRFTSPPLTLAMKVVAFDRRRLAPKGGTDLADIRRLLLTFPELRAEVGPVREALNTLGRELAIDTPRLIALWGEFVQTPVPDDDSDDEGY